MKRDLHPSLFGSVSGIHRETANQGSNGAEQSVSAPVQECTEGRCAGHRPKEAGVCLHWWESLRSWQYPGQQKGGRERVSGIRSQIQLLVSHRNSPWCSHSHKRR